MKKVRKVGKSYCYLLFFHLSLVVIVQPDTTITSAIDGNDVRLNNGDSTTSNKITFTFKGTDNVAVAGFECRLDGDNGGNNFNPCTSPITYNNLNSGVHTFEAIAIDT